MVRLAQSAGIGKMSPQPKTTPQWYAARVRSNYENNVNTVLEHKGVERFLPTYRSRRKWGDRIKTLDLPLFPGYVFCRIPLEDRNLVLTTGGVVDIVSIGRVPAPVSDAEIEAIRTVVGSRAHAEPWPFLNVGAHVRIAEGPLRGLNGILVQTKQEQRIVLSVSLLQRSVAVEVDRAWIERAA